MRSHSALSGRSARHVGGEDMRNRWAYRTGPVSEMLPQSTHRSDRPAVADPGIGYCRWCGVGIDLCDMGLTLCVDLERREAS